MHFLSFFIFVTIMWTILKSLICYNVVSVLSFGSFLALSMWDLSFPTKVQLQPPALEGKV